ncbi:two-component response regulator-like PRR73 [Rhodamnia argentea]|uniref:Two-component response regulator-like PRR73 n=1 Tax=Rhodamnia argentea TaxID=178133 RepID=A0ABM3HRY4_9MYRT|nr:two-component response regulator-like PRR73 [Rhodamnia argentea]
MGALPVDNDSGNDGVSVEQSIHMHHEQNGGTNGNMHEEQCRNSSEEDNSKSNDVTEYGNVCPSLDIQAHDGFQVQAQQPQGPQQPHGPTVLWETFLPIKTVKVLLVENDDSTRQVVSALLRNCGYEVTAVANGIQAWKILEDPMDQIDLVLTEVVMPLLTGIGLLSRIMGHKTFKNIPVIMMSSHDSMGIVFKCLSKGAVDFLVKPIRKNELKNLWQHVWRRCHSSSGSGSESGTHTKMSKELRSNDGYETNNGSSEEQDNGSNGLSMQNGSDDGSGTQSSWTKKTAEADSPKPVSTSNEWADAPDSTCAQVIHTGAETLKMEEEEPGTAEMGKDGKRAATCQDSKHGYQHDRCQDSMHKYQHDRSKNAPSIIEPKPFDKGQPGLDFDLGGKSRNKEPKMTGETANYLDVQTESTVFDTRDGISKISPDCDSKELPSLELTLKRLEGVGDSGKSALGDHKVLRHSDLSAFSKFNATSSVNQGQAGTTGSCSAFDNCSVAVRMERDFPSCSLGTPPYRQSNTSSSNNEFGLSSKTAIKPEVVSTFKSSESSAFQPVQHGYVSSSWQELSGRENDACSNTIQPPSTSPRQHIHIRYHHHHHHHHYHHHLDSLQQQQQQQQPDHKDLSVKNMAAATPRRGSSNAFQDHLEGNTGNYSVSGSVSGSNHGSNGNTGSRGVPNGGENDKVKDEGVAGHPGDGVTENVNGGGPDEERILLREAALSKFRQKRKERCFEKRVRYESRKKLAEQRPRVRGQFVRQTTSDSKVVDDCQSNDSISKDNSCNSVR